MEEGEEQAKRDTERGRKQKTVLVVQPIPPQLLPTCLGATCTG